MAVDVTTGRPAPGFGRGGRIDAYVGVVSEIVGESRRSTFTIPILVSVYRNLGLSRALVQAKLGHQVRAVTFEHGMRPVDDSSGRFTQFRSQVSRGTSPISASGGAMSPARMFGRLWLSMSKTELCFAPTGDLNSKARGTTSICELARRALMPTRASSSGFVKSRIAIFPTGTYRRLPCYWMSRRMAERFLQF